MNRVEKYFPSVRPGIVAIKKTVNYFTLKKTRILELSVPVNKDRREGLVNTAYLKSQD